MFPVIPEFLLVGVVLKISPLLSPSEASRCGPVTLGSLTWVCVCLRTQPWSSPPPFTSQLRRVSLIPLSQEVSSCLLLSSRRTACTKACEISSSARHGVP